VLFSNPKFCPLCSYYWRLSPFCNYKFLFQLLFSIKIAIIRKVAPRINTNSSCWRAEALYARRIQDDEVSGLTFRGKVLQLALNIELEVSPVNTIPAFEIKRRGISIVDDQIESGPVHVIKNNRPQYVVMSEDRYQAMIDNLNEARELRIKASLEEAVAGQTRQGSAEALIREIFSAD